MARGGSFPHHHPTLSSFLRAVRDKCQLCWQAHRLLRRPEQSALEDLVQKMEAATERTGATQSPATSLYWYLDWTAFGSRCPVLFISVRGRNDFLAFWSEPEGSTLDLASRYWLHRIHDGLFEGQVRFLPTKGTINYRVIPHQLYM